MVFDSSPDSFLLDVFYDALCVYVFMQTLRDFSHCASRRRFLRLMGIRSRLSFSAPTPLSSWGEKSPGIPADRTLTLTHTHTIALFWPLPTTFCERFRYLCSRIAGASLALLNATINPAPERATNNNTITVYVVNEVK